MSNEFWRQWQPRGPFDWPGEPWPPPGAAASGFGSFAEFPERFAAAAREFVANAQRAAAPSKDASQAALAAAESFGNFLRDQFAGCFRPPWPSPQSGSGMSSAFTEAPALGIGREQALRAQRAADAWKRLLEAQDKLQRLWSDTLREAATAFSSRPRPTPDGTLTQEAIDRLYDQWIDCAEESYARTARSEQFCDALAAFVNAGSEWRRESAAGIEDWSKALDLPTRSEMNALMLRLRELETQIAAMRRPAQRARTATSPKAPPAPKSARSAKSRAASSKRGK